MSSNSPNERTINIPHVLHAVARPDEREEDTVADGLAANDTANDLLTRFVIGRRMTGDF